MTIFRESELKRIFSHESFANIKFLRSFSIFTYNLPFLLLDNLRNENKIIQSIGLWSFQIMSKVKFDPNKPIKFPSIITRNSVYESAGNMDIGEKSPWYWAGKKHYKCHRNDW